jgi:enterochelin esterase-like enzyme
MILLTFTLSLSKGVVHDSLRSTLEVLEMKKTLAIFGLAVLLLIGCTAKPENSASITAPIQTDTNQYLVRVGLESQALAESWLGTSTYQKFFAILPPDYFTTQNRYPVVYYLHSYGESANEITQFSAALKTEMEHGTASDMVFIGVNGNDPAGVSFYVNSPATGKWEDYIVHEVVTKVDSMFRTIPDAAHRGLAGFSMGGFSVLHLGLAHPDVYSRVFSLSPGVFNKNGLYSAMQSLDIQFKNAYGAAFSPNHERPPSYTDIPRFDGTPADSAVQANWETGFGHWIERLAAYRAGSSRLLALSIHVGQNDNNWWIPQGCAYLHDLIDTAGITHEYRVFNRGHQFNEQILREEVLPFFTVAWP